MSIKHTAAIASLGALLISVSALALNVSPSIDLLPKKGEVAINGTVKSLEGDKKFILLDANGKTIDVNVSSPLTVREGEKVSVNGTMDSEFLGMGREINQASVTKPTVAQAAAKLDDMVPTSSMDKDFGARSDNEKYGSDKNRETTAYKGDIDVNIDADVDVDAERVDNEDASKKDQYADMKNNKSIIKALPEKGDVMVTGKVESVDLDDRTFTLRDSSGETIDVHTSQKLQVKNGDKVKVNGRMQDEVAGLGEEIVNAKITVLSRR